MPLALIDILHIYMIQIEYESDIYITYTDIYYRQRQDTLDILNAPEIGLLLIT